MNKLVPILLTMLSFMVSADTEKLTDPEKMSRLRSGDIVLVDTRKDEAGGAIRVEILVRAAVEEIWAVVEGCEKAFIFVEGLEQCEVLEQSDDYALIHQLVKKDFPAPTQEYTYESRSQAYKRMDFKLVEGSLKAMEGSWEFVAVAEGVLIIYHLHVRPGMSAPRFMVRRSIRKTIPDMLACIRGLVKGSGSTEQNEKDLNRCSGDV